MRIEHVSNPEYQIRPHYRNKLRHCPTPCSVAVQLRHLYTRPPQALQDTIAPSAPGQAAYSLDSADESRARSEQDGTAREQDNLGQFPFGIFGIAKADCMWLPQRYLPCLSQTRHKIKPCAVPASWATFTTSPRASNSRQRILSAPSFIKICP